MTRTITYTRPDFSIQTWSKILHRHDQDPRQDCSNSFSWTDTAVRHDLVSVWTKSLCEQSCHHVVWNEKEMAHL